MGTMTMNTKGMQRYRQDTMGGQTGRGCSATDKTPWAGRQTGRVAKKCCYPL